MPNSRYDSFTFLSHDTFVLPCARTESLNIFIFRPTPPAGEFDRGPAIKHLCALQLPELVNEAKYVSVTCRSRPTPESVRSPLPTQKLERPPKYFEPDRDSGIVVFSAHVTNTGRGKDISIICNRKSLLRFIDPDPELLGDPLPEPWESYPYVIQFALTSTLTNPLPFQNGSSRRVVGSACPIPNLARDLPHHARPTASQVDRICPRPPYGAVGVR